MFPNLCVFRQKPSDVHQKPSDIRPKPSDTHPKASDEEFKGRITKCSLLPLFYMIEKHFKQLAGTFQS